MQVCVTWLKTRRVAQKTDALQSIQYILLVFMHITTSTHDKMTMSQVFLPNGPLALLPVRDGYSNIVWSTTPAEAAQLESLSPEGFVAAANLVRLCILPLFKVHCQH